METTFEPSNLTLPADFDPFKQTISLLTPDGTLVSFPITDARTLVHDVGEACIVYGAQIGGCFMMILVVLLITRTSSRKSPIFFLNIASLLFALLRAIWQIIYWTGPWNDFYMFMSGDFAKVPKSATTHSVIATIIPLLLLTTIEASLVLQTRVVCLTMMPLYRRLVVVFSVLLVSLAICVRLVYIIRSANWIIHFEAADDMKLISKLNIACEMVSILYFCAIFVGKLAWTCWLRRRMGLEQWGPMQIICVCGGCTMVIPGMLSHPLTHLAPYRPFFFSSLALTHDTN